MKNKYGFRHWVHSKNTKSKALRYNIMTVRLQRTQRNKRLLNRQIEALENRKVLNIIVNYLNQSV